jgi:hypothetical protein
MNLDIKDLYIKNDLTDYVEYPSNGVDGYARTDYIKAILPEKADIEVYNHGSYQGTLGFVIRLDGYYWLIKEHYGSCSVCDSMMAADDKIEYAKSILRNAYCIENEENAIKFLIMKEEDGSYGWRNIAPEMRDIVRGE